MSAKYIIEPIVAKQLNLLPIELIELIEIIELIAH